jgi:hypothetical protein
MKKKKKYIYIYKGKKEEGETRGGRGFISIERRAYIPRGTFFKARSLFPQHANPQRAAHREIVAMRVIFSTGYLIARS